ncbi:MAG: hypothetical protein MJZ51_00425 [Bacteroidales bacterium]|nr:hypothetical protein [Bacteroidales bacterium]
MNTSNTAKNWKNSGHKCAYFFVALLHFTTPDEIYRIAHSHFLETPREGRICRQLVRLGVLKEVE